MKLLKIIAFTILVPVGSVTIVALGVVCFFGIMYHVVFEKSETKEAILTAYQDKKKRKIYVNHYGRMVQLDEVEARIGGHL